MKKSNDTFYVLNMGTAAFMLRRVEWKTGLNRSTSCSELDQQNAVEGLDSGGDDYIRKPFQTVELISRIKANLRVKSAHDQLSKIKSELSPSRT